MLGSCRTDMPRRKLLSSGNLLWKTVRDCGYDNPYEHIEVNVVEDPKQYKPILDWIHDLQELAEDKFHRSFAP